MHKTRKPRLVRIRMLGLIGGGLCIVTSGFFLAVQSERQAAVSGRSENDKTMPSGFVSRAVALPRPPSARPAISEAPAPVVSGPSDLFLSRCTVLQQSHIRLDGSEWARFLLVRDPAKGKLFRVEEKWSDASYDGSARLVSRSIFSSSHVLIKVAPNACTSAIQSVLARSGLGLRLSRQVAPGVFSVELSQTDLDSVPRALGALRPYVLHAEADGIGFGAGSPPSDPLFSQQWNLAKTNPSEADIGAGSLWDAVPSGAAVTIAVLDTGVNYAHPDLSTLERRGFDFVNQDDDPSDDHGHGTGVAGVIFAARNNGFGTAGILPDAELLAVKILKTITAPDGSLDMYGLNSHLVAGLAYARTNGASVVNLSLIEWTYSELVAEELARCQSNNMIVCVSAGNKGTDNDQSPDYPSSYTNANIISVGGHGKTGDRWSVTNRFPSNFGATSVDIFAPGADILSGSTNEMIWSWTGSSFAAPHVAAVAAALRVLRTNWTALQIKSVILSSAATNSALASLCVSGGRLDAAAAVTKSVPPPDPPVITSTTTARGQVGNTFIYQIATEGGAPTSYRADGLPAGLSVDTTTGAITGKPTAAGTFSVSLSATNADGTDSATLTLTVVGNRRQTITFRLPSNMVYGGEYMLKARATSKLKIAYEVVGDTSAAMVDGSDKLTILKAAPFKVTARQAGDSKWAAATSLERSANPGKRPQQVKLSVTGKREVGHALQVRVKMNSDLTPELKSSNEEVIGVSALQSVGNREWSATAAILKKGRATLSASQLGDSNHRGAKTAKRPITVTK